MHKSGNVLGVWHEKKKNFIMDHGTYHEHANVVWLRGAETGRVSEGSRRGGLL